jgi:predicted enzyme related to lactoylglutathione lyase
MDSAKQSLFKLVDCVELYVPDIRAGIEYYCGKLGLRLLWKQESSAGLGLSEGATEVVIQNERPRQEIDFKVDSVEEALPRFVEAGGRVLHGPFDIPIGRCAVVLDPWDNRYVILDTTKGTHMTDADGNIIGQNAPS